MYLDFEKVRSLTDEEKAEVVKGIPYDDLLRNGYVLARNRVTPESILERPDTKHLKVDIIGILLAAGAAPEKILERVSDDELERLHPIIMADLYNDETAGRLLDSIKSIAKFVSFVNALNSAEVTMPKEMLFDKLKNLILYESDEECATADELWLPRVTVLLDAGVEANDLLDLIEELTVDDLRACKVLLERGADPKRMLGIIKRSGADYLGVLLLHDLRKHGSQLVEIDNNHLVDMEEEFLTHCKAKIEDEESLKRMIGSGISPQLIAEVASDIDFLDFKILKILVGAGVNPAVLAYKMTNYDFEHHYHELKYMGLDFDTMIRSQLKEYGALNRNLQEFLAKYSDQLIRDGLSTDLLVRGITDNTHRVTLLQKSFDQLGLKKALAMLREMVREETEDEYGYGQVPEVFLAVVAHYDAIREAKGFPANRLRKLAEKYLEYSGYYRALDGHVDVILGNLDAVLKIYPKFNLQKQVDSATHGYPNVVIKYLGEILRHGVILDLEKFFCDKGEELTQRIDFEQAKGAIESGVSADWLLLQGKYWSFKIGKEEARFFIEHGANPNLVAYLYYQENGYGCSIDYDDIEEVIGQPTVWEKLAVGAQ